MDKAVFIVFIAASIIYTFIVLTSYMLESVLVCNILGRKNDPNHRKNKNSWTWEICSLKRTNFIISLLLFIGLWMLLSTQTKNNNLKTILLFMIIFQLITLNISITRLLYNNIDQTNTNRLMYALFMLAANSGVLVNLLIN